MLVRIFVFAKGRNPIPVYLKEKTKAEVLLEQVTEGLRAGVESWIQQ